MSTFYGTLMGEKKACNKQGQRRLVAHVRGWDHGIRVEYFLDSKDNAICRVYSTGGSHDPEETKLIKQFTLGKVSKKRPGGMYRGEPIGNGSAEVRS